LFPNFRQYASIVAGRAVMDVLAGVAEHARDSERFAPAFSF
jgi:hypothetical protein